MVCISEALKIIWGLRLRHSHFFILLVRSIHVLLSVEPQLDHEEATTAPLHPTGPDSKEEKPPPPRRDQVKVGGPKALYIINFCSATPVQLLVSSTLWNKRQHKDDLRPLGILEGKTEWALMTVLSS